MLTPPRLFIQMKEIRFPADMRIKCDKNRTKALLYFTGREVLGLG